MTQYLYTTPVLCMMLLCMLFLTVTNEFILATHKKGFFIAFLGEFFIIICEGLSIFLNSSAIAFKPIHFLSNYLGFLLSPILIILFATSIGNFRRFKGTIIGIIAYFVLLNCLVMTKQLFFIDAKIIIIVDYCFLYMLSRIFLQLYTCSTKRSDIRVKAFYNIKSSPIF